ncbi:ABC transporter permease [Chitinophaga sp. CF418]|uniref:ABC transporter permease n=1 Tax=Chitinophaga sp. CF418 TaxID=1855287 RepID=UPI000922D115|nr:ABC transporter permease [Chitinophaga sp. CF418]SHN12982.1 putative ABC transport system permease protein [Chitinophaga sp. CF418]
MKDPVQPPRWARWLLSRLHPDNTLEEVTGDLDELYRYRYKRSGKTRATLHYLLNVVSVVPPFVRRRNTDKQYYQQPDYRATFSLKSTMIQNYLKIAFRSLKRQKVSTSINIIGLAIGLATCILIMLYIQDELSYDRYHEKADRIFRVGLMARLDGEDVGGPMLGPNAARDLQQEIPEILKATRILKGGEFVSNGTSSFKEDNLLYTDSTFCEVFTIPFLKGDPKRALTEPNAVVLTEETARKYFGNQDPVGKVLLFSREKIPHRITGVVRNVPTNAHFRFDMLVSSPDDDEQHIGWMYRINYYTYVVLPEKYNYKKLEAKVAQLAERQIGAELQEFLHLSPKQFREKGNDFGIFLQPLTKIHLYSTFGGNELTPGGNILYVYVIIAIAAFMLLIACVNFMNLSTATAVRRSREIGVRKVLGSVKRQLQQQFLIESVLLAVAALIVALLIVCLSLPYFNQLTGKTLTLSLLTNAFVATGLIVGTVLVGLLAGSYPAFYLSSFEPVVVLKGRITAGRGSFNLRSGLVAFQFFITISMIIATVTADRQLRYMQAQKIGFNREQVLIIHDTQMLHNNETLFRDKIVQSPLVITGSISGQVPIGNSALDNTPVMSRENPDKAVMSRFYKVDDEYIPTLGMHMIEGRNFSKNLSTDSSAVILNETAVRALGWQQNPIGKELIGHIDDNGVKTYYRVIGVVSDFHFESLRQKIGPLVMFLGGNSGNILVKTRPGELPQLLASLKEQWESFSPAAPFSYSFLDDRFKQVYLGEQKIEQVLTLFSGLTIFIACLGLFGLATYTAEQRTKEIGVRKVLGASVGSVVALLSQDFLKPIVIALVLASPVAWWGMDQWLKEFAYKVTIDWWFFALAGLLAIGIALLTVSYQSIKAALTNPIKSLRNE